MIQWWKGIPNSTKNRWESWFWLAFAIPMVIWFRESVFVVAIMSLYANYKTADGAYEASKAKELMESKE